MARQPRAEEGPQTRTFWVWVKGREGQMPQAVESTSASDAATTLGPALQAQLGDTLIVIDSADATELTVGIA